MLLGGCTVLLHPFIWRHVSGLMRFRDRSNKGTASVHYILCNNAIFLSGVIISDESWIYDYDPEAKQQSSQWKGPNSPRPKKVKATVKV
jgi:hypothetical protein